MKRFLLLLLATLTLMGFFSPPNCPAPLVWRKGEGWTFERAGVTTANNPNEQLEIARKFQTQKSYGNAVSSYRRLIRRWPTSSAAQEARMGLAESLTALGYNYKAFKEYQLLIEKNPNTEHFDQVLQRQFEIGNLFLAGVKDKAWGIRLFPAVEKAGEIFAQVVKNGPYSKVGPLAQFRIGLTREKQRQYIEAVPAYEKLLERYPRDPMAETAQFQIGCAYRQQAARAEYDQDAANQSISAFTDFLIRYPQSDKVAQAEKYLIKLKQEQARGLFTIGEFYEKKKSYRAALICYNQVIEKNPESDWAAAAKEKVAHLTPRAAPATASP